MPGPQRAYLARRPFDIGNLTLGTWYFAVVVVNSSGVESAISNVATKTVAL